MRFVLMVALLLRLLPTPAHAMEGAHCIASGDATVAAEHAGHDAPSGTHHTGADHDDCPHCPPTDCAQQVHCSASTLATLLAESPRHAELVVVHRVASRRHELWSSQDHQPPVRPPSPA